MWDDYFDLVICNCLFCLLCMDVLFLLQVVDGLGASGDFCVCHFWLDYDFADLFMDRGRTALRFSLRPDLTGTRSTLQMHCVPVDSLYGKC